MPFCQTCSCLSKHEELVSCSAIHIYIYGMFGIEFQVLSTYVHTYLRKCIASDLYILYRASVHAAQTVLIVPTVHTVPRVHASSCASACSLRSACSSSPWPPLCRPLQEGINRHSSRRDQQQGQSNLIYSTLLKTNRVQKFISFSMNVISHVLVPQALSAAEQACYIRFFCC